MTPNQTNQVNPIPARYQIPTPTNRSSATVQRDITETQTFLNTTDKPSIPYLQRKVDDLTTQTLLAPPHEAGKVKADLLEATHRLSQGKQTLQALADAEAKLVKLNDELDGAKYAERMQRIELADKELQSAIDDYFNVVKQLVRAFRRVLDQQKISRCIPGASTSIPRGFNVAEMIPTGWSGTVSEMMANGWLPWERREQEQKKSLEEAIK